MPLFTHRKTSMYRRKLLAGLVCTMMLVSYHPYTTPRAEAVAATIVGGVGTVQDTISAGANTLMAGFQSAFFIKEFTLDGIAHALAKMVLKSMTQSILNWINSGFQGSPAFVTDLKQFLRDRVDQVIDDFINNDPALNFLCSPFQLDVKIALATAYQESAHGGLGAKAQCTLSDVTDNVEGFLNGAFNEGGWESWFELTQNPVNTPTGALLTAETEMYARIVDEEGRTIRELDWGDGFLSFKVCADTARQQNCSITTPGRVIADQINKSLGAGQDALISADEINEIIGALFAQLAKVAITGAGGLLGLSNDSYTPGPSIPCGTSNSFLDQLCEENQEDGAVNPFIGALEREAANTDLQNQIITAVDAVETRLDNAISSNDGCVALTLPNSLIRQRDAAAARIIRNNANTVTLNTMNSTFSNSTDSQTRLDLATELNRLQQDGSLTSFTENNLLSVSIQYELTAEISAFDTQIRQAISRCRSSDR